MSLEISEAGGRLNELGLVVAERERAPAFGTMRFAAACALLATLNYADALRVGASLAVTPRRSGAVSPRASAPAAKLLSRNKIDFASQDNSVAEFGLQANVLGLAPKTDSAALLALSVLVARSHRLPMGDLLFAFAFPAWLTLANGWRFGLQGDSQAERQAVPEPIFKPLLREGRLHWPPEGVHPRGRRPVLRRH